jgi:hypothetical protein
MYLIVAEPIIMSRTGRSSWTPRWRADGETAESPHKPVTKAAAVNAKTKRARGSDRSALTRLCNIAGGPHKKVERPAIGG